ncbi:carboxylating nicotinate-nucleotide diphosphorylase [Rhodocyclus tenuis]|uniref:nicotinate-nucleotide diphosphorylase (carboxylating) n=2 Tax=Rhodocyclus TaxID=1064 RepID=A0ABX0WLB3_9RHOO|nr:carboxylating nicotinate-nucleotide diphosphorylase [Rhodocyclus gracilis]MQY52008.1 carboxylating nicotinate-nucleotide diphosphorylase [Rhodocyclus gracilis]MRD73620.1 carboxylating nicotinate-nucleotide diphosphorylase [Rhodocyclus gracilis]NJA89738.1 carboxylating nicotinate-nucleotide diphosphorylase [Rhodocyclus gracilis]
MIPVLPPLAEIDRNVAATIDEDVGAGDLTAQLIAADRVGHARIVSREAAVLCGTAWFERSFAAVDRGVSVRWNARDGEHVAAGDVLCEITGPARALLTGERTALNFLQLLSGVATRTREFVDAVAGTRARIVDTRKTLPGLRRAQKYAVACGGGDNHRLGLHDAILIKENHIAAAGGITPALRAAQNVAAQAGERCQFIQVEVENLDELREALDAGATMILLDNMTLAMMREAVALTAERAILEASGNVSLATVAAIAATGVDRISIGALTKDVRALDLSMRFID